MIARAWRALDLDVESARRLFFALLGLVGLFAFVSLNVQIRGLVGEHGVLPIAEAIDAMGRHAARSGDPSELGRLHHSFPTLCWFDASDASLTVQCGFGVALSALLLLGVAPLFVLPGVWALYLSLTVAGQEFLRFQWDLLLLETVFFATWFAPSGLLPWGPPRWLWLRPRRASDPRPAPPTIVSTWALRLLFFRFMFASGVVKLTSGDDCWRDFTALTYHYWSQPLPTRMAWYASQAPLWFLKFSCALMFVGELVLPFGVFLGSIGRRVCVTGTIALMTAIATTGNYGFFEPLTVVLCVPLLGNSRSSKEQWRPVVARAFRVVTSSIAAAAGLFALVQFSGQVWPLFSDSRPPSRRPTVEAIAEAIDPFDSLNTYGLFRVMTRDREEIVLEGSDDGVTWKPYEFRWKPGDVAVAPCWCAPHMPRLDWQMWFAALDERPPYWFQRFVARLLEGEPTVLALLATNPFGDRAPRLVRATSWQFRFTTASERAQTGAWWKREATGVYLRPTSLRR